MGFVISDVCAYTSTTSHLMFGCKCVAPYLSLTPHISACMSNSSLTPSMVFVWLLGFVCLLFPDGRHRLHLSSFQVPREIFTALAEALILFPLVGLYDRPFIHSNWKQLSLPVWAGGKVRAGTVRISLSSSEFYIHTLSSSWKRACLFFHGDMVFSSWNNKTTRDRVGFFQMLTWKAMTVSVLTAYRVWSDFARGPCWVLSGIIKVRDIMYLQEPRRETCPSKCGGGPVNVFTHRMRF